MPITRRFPPGLIPAALAAALAMGPGCAGAKAPVGSEAPAIQLTDAEGKQHSLAAYEDQVVVLEWINPECPFSRRHAEEKTMIDLAAGRPVVWLAVNSTKPDHENYLTPAEHQAYNEQMGIEYPVLYDSSGAVGRAYGAKTTPHMYVITDGRIVYNGAIDDDPRGAEAPPERTNYVAGALTAVDEGATPKPATTKPYGCTVKY